jgi:hypothetical protein
MKNKPNFFLLGAPKCGTTAMSKYLAAHPEVFFAHPQEPGYFDRRFRYISMKECAYATQDDYLGLYDRADPDRHKAIGEGSVYMMYSGKILDEILRLSPSAKFIVMLRNPYLAAISMHGQNLKAYSQGREPKVEFADAWADLGNRDTDEISGVPPLKFRYDVLFAYNEHIQRIKATVGERDLKLVIYDDFKEDNIEVARSVYEFLGVSREFRPALSTVNERAQARDNLFTRSVFWAARQARQYRFLRRLRGKGLALNRFTQQKLPRPTISAELMQQMRAVYHEDIQKLEVTIGRDLGEWLNTDLASPMD